MFRVYLQGNNNKISLKKPFPCGLHNADRAKPGAQGIKYRACFYPVALLFKHCADAKTDQPVRVQVSGSVKLGTNGGTARQRAQILAHQVKLELLRPPFKLEF